MKKLLLPFCLLIALGINAQTITILSQLPDSLQPKTIQLNTRKAPRTIAVPTKLGGSYVKQYKSGPKTINLTPPTIRTFAPNITQGKAFFTTYNSDDGLALDAINYGNSTVCDSEGNIWFATQGGGVSKYDGESFITYTTSQGLANNTVFSIAEDKTGTLWFGTDGGGVSKYDGKSFITYTTSQGLANNTVRSIAEDNSGNLWFGTYGGVSKYDGSRVTPCHNNTCEHNLRDQKEHNKELAKSFITYTTSQGLANNTVLSIVEDNSGNLWFSTYDGVSKYDGETSTKNNCTQNKCNHNLRVQEDIIKHNKIISQSFITYTTAQGLANNSVLSIAEDKKGNLWFGTYGGGVSKYDGETNTKNNCTQNKCNHDLRTQEDLIKHNKIISQSFITYTTAQGLANNSVRSIAEDKSGNLWFSTDGGGVSKYDGNRAEDPCNKGTCKHDMRAQQDKKKHNATLAKSFITYTTAQGLANNSVRSIAEDKSGNLWLGTYGGVSKYDGKSFITYSTAQGLVNNTVLSIAEDKKGNLWFGTYGGGVSKYDGKSFITYTTAQGLANNSVFSIAEDKSGNLWFGTYSGGVSKYDGESFITYTTAQGLANNSVLSIAEDKSGNIWFGTEQGLSLLVSRSGVVSATINELNMRKVTIDLPDNYICAVRFDDKDRLIIGTNFGLTVIPAEEVERILNSEENTPLNPLSKGEIEIYNQFTGYPIRDVNTGQNNGTMHVDSEGILWVGHGANGVTRVDLDAVNKSSEAPNVVINKVSVKGEGICWYDLGNSEKEIVTSNADSTTLVQQEVATYGMVLSKEERDTLSKRFAGIAFDGITKFYPLPENLVLPYEHNALTFEFNAIETSRNFLVNYQFALVEGKHTPTSSQKGKLDWSPITKKHEATYNNLWEGEYTFLLKAQSPWGVWSEPIEFKFKILPPWQRTWWAYAAYAGLLAVSIWLLVRFQTKKLKQRQEELENEVKIATAEVKSTLVKVKKQKEHIEEVHKEMTDSINYAERIQRSFLATKELLDENLGDYFVLFQPKDVVSGDFYWAGKLDNGTFAVVNADSTGHGVPGAIMSILNTSSIEEAVKEGAIEPSKIFNRARTFIINRLKKDGSEHGGKDGMDASIVCFNADKTKMTYCAAQNPIWVIRAGNIIQIKGEKMPIGKHDNDHIPFIGGEFDLQKGDIVYTLTDGFQDQFGGPKGKKFMIKKMREYVLSISHLPMGVQHQKLEEVFSNWKGNLEQVDDVCVIGVRV